MSSEKKHPPFRAVATFLDIRSASGMSLRNLVKQLNQIQAVWSEVVSTELARHARPSYYDDGRLTIAADSPVWANSIRHSQHSLVRGLQRRGFSELRSIRVAIAPADQRRGARTLPRPRPSSAVQAVLDATAKGIQDAELRAALLKLRDTLGRDDET